MKKNVAIYLAGSIKKGHETDTSYWSDVEMHQLKESLDGYEVSLLNPAFRTDDLSNQFSVFGRDMLQVYCSNVVFVDARDRRGLGVGAEMMWAKFHKIPIVVLAPKESHYNKSNTTILGIPVKDGIHPFIASLADAVVETVAEGGKWIQQWMAQPSQNIKSVEYIESSMLHYREDQLQQDAPMKSLIEANEGLKKRIHDLDVKLSLKQRPKVGVAVVVIKNGQILLGKRKGSHGSKMWQTPGGHLEFAETIEACARRELLEEVGLNALSIRLGPWTNNVIEETKHYVTIFTFVDRFNGEPQLLEPDKCEEWRWFDWDNLPSPLLPPLATMIQQEGLEKLKQSPCLEIS